MLGDASRSYIVGRLNGWQKAAYTLLSRLAMSVFLLKLPYFSSSVLPFLMTSTSAGAAA